MIVVPPPRIIVLSSDAFTEARCERMSAADPTPTVKSSTTISDRLSTFNRPSMFPSSAQPLGAGGASGPTARVASLLSRGEFRPPESPLRPLRVSGSAVDAYALDAQVGDAHARSRRLESAVRRRVQKPPTFILTGQQGYGTDVTDQLQRQPRADHLEVCQNGQDRRLDLAKEAKPFCVVTHERRGLPETRGDQRLGCRLGLIEQSEVAAPLHPSCAGVECPSPVHPHPRYHP